MSHPRKLSSEERGDDVYEFAQSLYEEKNFQEALSKFTDAIKLNERSSKIYLGRANTYQQLALMEKNSKEKRDLFELASKDILIAIKIGSKGIINLSELSQNAYLLGKYLYAKKDYAEAVYQFDLAIKLNSKFVNAYIERGTIFQEGIRTKYSATDRRNLIEAAINDYESAYKIDPNDKLALSNLGKAYCQYAEIEKEEKEFKKANKLFDKSYKFFSQLIKIYPSDAEAYCLLGNTLYNQHILLENTPQGIKTLDESIKNFEMAFKIDPQNHEIKKGRSLAIWKKTGELSELNSENRPSNK